MSSTTSGTSLATLLSVSLFPSNYG